MDNKDVTVPDQTIRQWAMYVHLSALSGYLIPLGHIIAPIILWSIKREDEPFIDDQGKESINFQISMTLYLVIAGILSLVLIGLILLPILLVMHLIFIVIASVKSNQGTLYRYPLTIRFVS
ncbi:DUF4870 domain-containing protein [Anaerobacillus sp. 1_MG-2023]|uniref:DUF4870 domain-containing protein n=1 Tax=Bacillales TaxID=1385 RepID=UPI0026E3584B|nr:DUF4870 domain-containing protein [Anaerobacillus sp. 1_MG-2023]MDO6656637.1 DUF4870 domain-containing protein [Anaerobacillus sp. 1_MG-2023]